MPENIINAFGGDAVKTLPKTTVKDDADDKVKEQWRSYQRARDAGHLDYIEEARKFDEYYRGEQWEDSVIQTLDAQQRPHHTINLVLSTVNSVIGEYIATREEIALKPRGKGANQETASALTATIKQILYNNDSQWNEQNVVLDGLIEDRGYFQYFLNFEDSIVGEVREIVVDPQDVILDPAAKEYDPRTWSEIYISRWLTPDEIGALYGPEKAEQLKFANYNETLGSDSLELEAPTFGDDFREADAYSTFDVDVRKVRRVRVIHREHRVLTRTAYFVDTIEGDMRRVPGGWSPEKAVAFAEQMGLEIIWKPERRIRVTVTADHVLLHDDWSLFDYFSLVPFFPYFRRGRPFGLVRNLISPQDMLNKVTSQELHVVNTTANSGWKFQSGSLVNMDADDLAQMGSKTGLVLEYMQGAEPPEKIQPNQIPTGLDQIASKAQMFFREINGVNEAMLGVGKSDSSKALDTRRKGGLVQMEVIFDNLAKTRKYRAELLIHIVQRYYTETRLLQIINLNEDGEEEVSELPINQPQPTGEILNDLTLGEYAVVISSIPRADTLDDTVFQQLIQMRELGVVIPDWVLVEHSMHPERRDLAQLIKKITGMAEPTPEELQFQQILQELQLRTAQAELQLLEAEALEKQAKAEESLAKADNLSAQPQLEAAKVGAKMRETLTAKGMEIQQNREDLATRLRISDDKNETARFVAQVESATDRVSGALKRDADLEKARLGIQKARSRSPKSDNNSS